jgi:Asp-tRNA(Asn)/Glu-tRNA(Gln) amidotransferase A subunit family amidase
MAATSGNRERRKRARGNSETEIWELSAVDLAAALHRRELSATQALEAVLRRADQVERDVNPFSLRLDDRARRTARAADAALARGDGGPLCGVPVTTKDSHWMAGVECTSGSRARAGFVPQETVGAIERLETAGAVVFARTTTPEFCYFGITESARFGRTSNPWNLDRTPGGSSGGASAAVAAGAGPLSLGGDGGGSIRIPAAFCGIVGFKPTFGLVPHEPSSPGWKTLVAVGPMARSVADARLLLRGIVGPDPRDRHSVPPGPLDVPAPEPHALRVAVSEDLGFAPLDDDVRRAFRAAVTRLADAGVSIVPAAPGLGSSVEIWSAIATAEARYSEAEEYESHRGLLTPPAVEFIAAGEQVTAAQYIQAQFARERIHRAYVDLFARTRVSALLTPTVGCEAFSHGRRHPDTIGGVPVTYPDLDWAPFLYDANLAGLPACAIPIGLGDDGLPVSMQVLGLRRDDGRVLAAAETIETLIGFTARPPRNLSPLSTARHAATSSTAQSRRPG